MVEAMSNPFERGPFLQVAALCEKVLYEHDGKAYIRDVGSWDPMPWYIRLPYQIQGEKAQHAFWGLGTPRQSMLHQIALATA